VRGSPLTALVPIVVLTSSSERSDMVACYKSGANSFVRKPVDFGDLTEKLNRLQSFWLDVNESMAAG
jgi:two-component system response regulator